MNCKNCSYNIDKENLFCNHCGAKIITKRITFKFILLQILDGFGFKSTFLFTLKKLLIEPHIVLLEYIDGTRKKYMKPFSFLIIGTTLALATFNLFKSDYDEMTNSFRGTKEQTELINKDLSKLENIDEDQLKKLEIRQKSLKFEKRINQFIFKYFTIFTLLFVPFYALLSKWTYMKPHNYGEHIVINTYLNAVYMYFSILFFFIAKFTKPAIFFVSMFTLFFYYCYTFSKLYKHNLKQTLLKILRFLLISTILFTTLITISVLIGFIHEGK